MKVIILAAGQGTRLWKYTRDNPKGMINFIDKPLLKHQIDLFSKLGLHDITIVKGYMAEKINFKNIKYYENDKYASTNMVESLMCASNELNDDCIVTYSDLIFDSSFLSSLLSFEGDMGVCVDIDFEEYWRARLGKKYKEDMESLSISEEKIIDIGRSASSFSEVDGRYVGAIKFSKKGINSLLEYYNKNKLISPLNSLGTRNFDNWHMTDLLQELINEGQIIRPISINRGWLEFDTEEDYENYNKWHNEGSLRNYIGL